MNDAVWKFKTFEEPSLSYSSKGPTAITVGGWNVRRDEKFARLIELGLINFGEIIYSSGPMWSVTGLITEDYGIAVNGLRFESPDLAAQAATNGESSGGWDFWHKRNGSELTSLRELLNKI